ncbi:uncharacterized protein LOC129569764 [Sitodiplosis mosellana]|uniref:uncharacterized protein LOC129569764 n=1 Tax=Sitodiplosis mosellana TaxID=263140 RepID=UPI002444D2FA|nr:uncharacterized protein LOC129569764 [Sitodiplosis mosellana]
MSSKSKKRNAQAKNTPNPTHSTEEFKKLMEVFETVQEHEEQHQQCIEEALDIYRQWSHKEFMYTIVLGMKEWMRVESFDHTYAQTGLRFLARLAVSNYANDPDNKIVTSITEYLLEHTSINEVVRQFICYFIYYLVRYANILKVPIDVDAIVSYIITESYIHGRQWEVREQAAKVLLLFQDRPNALEALLEHLYQDPKAEVRRLIIKSIQFSVETVPYILDRLQDINENVRVELYKDLIERDVRTLTNEHRCRILNSAYHDHSNSVQEVITNRLIPSWLRRYNNSYLALLAAIKFDANDEDIKGFLRLSKYVLFNLFRKFTSDGHIERLCEQLGLKTDGEFVHCMPFDRLSLGMLIFWWLLIQFGRHETEDQSPVEQIMSDVDPFCKYIQAFLSRMDNKNPDDWTQNGYKLQILIEILHELHVDEFGRKSLGDFVSNTLLNETQVLNETTISGLVKCAEKSVRNDILGQYFSEILRGICDKIPSIDQKIDEIIELIQNDDLKLRITQIKSQILELKEEADSSINESNYRQLRTVRHQIKELRIQIVDICRDYCAYDHEKDIDISAYELSTEEIIKCLQIFFYSCHSIKSTRAPPEMIFFYGDFVYQQLDAENLDVRGWALKCNASFALRFDIALYEGIEACYNQFLLNNEPTLWSISVTTICELLDKHRVEFQVPHILADTNDGNLVNMTDFLFDILTRIQHEEIKNSLIIGLCRLILSNIITDKEKIAFMLVEMFNPEAYPSSQQILSQFVESLTKLKCHSRLISALGPALELISKSGQKIKFKDIITFLIAITIPELPHVTSIWHNQLAIELAKLMLQGYDPKLMNIIRDKLKVDVNDEFKQQIRPLLAELLRKLPEQSKQSVKAIWKKLGFKNSDLNAVQPSSSPSATTSSSSMVLTEQSSPQSGSAPDSTGATRASLNRCLGSNRTSSVSTRNKTIVNDENAAQPKSKADRSQRANTGPTRRAFGNRANI